MDTLFPKKYGDKTEKETSISAEKKPVASSQGINKSTQLETINQLPNSKGLQFKPQKKSKKSGTIRNILSSMGEGLASQHLSESAFTQDLDDALALPKARKRNTDIDQTHHSSLDPDRHSIPNKRILVVGQESGFSEILMAKALGLAQRNICGIVALSVIPLDKKFFSILSRNTKEEIIVCVNNAAAKFKEKVGMLGIPLTHLTRVGKDDVVSAELDNNLKSISFVLVESASQKEAIRTSIAVYSVETTY